MDRAYPFIKRGWPAVHMHPTILHYASDTLSFDHCPQVILPVSRGSADLLEAPFDGFVRVVGDKFDFRTALAWLRRCTKHRDCAVTSTLERPCLERVVDCRTRELVAWSGQRYVALSYVWGCQTPVTIEEDIQTRTSLRLPSKVPQTIEDAMAATLGIGE